MDAYERLMKLTLTEVQQREIARVLLQCSGNVSICYKMLIYTNTIVLTAFDSSPFSILHIGKELQSILRTCGKPALQP